MERELALDIAREYAMAVRRFMDVRAVFLFGPWAQGEADDSCDIEIAVVVDDVPREYTDADTELVLWSMAQDRGHDIDPVLLFAEGTSEPFLRDLEENGIPL